MVVASRSDNINVLEFRVQCVCACASSTASGVVNACLPSQLINPTRLISSLAPCDVLILAGFCVGHAVDLRRGQNDERCLRSEPRWLRIADAFGIPKRIDQRRHPQSEHTTLTHMAHCAPIDTSCIPTSSLTERYQLLHVLLLVPWCHCMSMST